VTDADRGGPGRAENADPPAREAQIRDILSEGELRPLGLMPRASNYTFLAEVREGSQTVLAVYKPRAGEAPLWDFPEGTLCHREVAAFVLAERLGWPDVPLTVLRDGPHGVGSVQLFVEADARQHFFTLREGRPEDFRAVAAFDVVANNADRKGGHCLLAPDGTIRVVDHGVCFSTDTKLRTVIWDFAGDTLPPAVIDSLTRACGELRSGELRAELLELLTRSEVDAVARRTEALLRAGRFPYPTHPRAYPWPPV